MARYRLACHAARMSGITEFPSSGRQPPTGVCGSVLLVDPDADTRLLYRTALEPLGAIISEAEDGADALGKAVCDPPAIVITETRLSRLDGFALCACLRRNPITAHVHIVVASASPSTPAHDAIAAGADEVLLKPYAIDALVDAVRGVLQRAGKAAAQ